MTGRIDENIGRNDDGPKSGNGVGALLRASRIRCGEDLSQVADALRIRLIYLQAIEDGRFADLPGATYALGFVRTYASHLGLDVEEVIRRLRAETEIETAKPDLSFPIPVSDTTMPTGAVVMIGLIVAAVAYGGYLMNSTGDRVPVADVSPVPKRMMIDGATANAQSNAAPQPDASARIETAAGTPASASPPSAAQPSTPPSAAKPASPPLAVQTSTPPSAAKPSTPSPTAQPSATPTAATASAPSSGAPSSGIGESQQLAALPQSTPAASSSSGAAPAPSSSSGAATSAPAPSSLGAATSVAAPSSSGAATSVAAPAETPKLPRIEVLAKADSWIQVREGTAGAMLMTRLLRAGETYAVPDRSGLMLLTGNAGALEIRVDGEAVPTLGPEGAVRRSIALDAGRLKSGTAAAE